MALSFVNYALLPLASPRSGSRKEFKPKCVSNPVQVTWHYAVSISLCSVNCFMKFVGAVAFRIYDLKDTGVIEKDEVKRLLTQLLHDNPAIDLTDDEVDAIVEQVSLQCRLLISEVIRQTYVGL